MIVVGIVYFVLFVMRMVMCVLQITMSSNVSYSDTYYSLIDESTAVLSKLMERVRIFLKTVLTHLLLACMK